MLALVLTALGGSAGCTSATNSGSLRAASLGDNPVFLDGEYVTAVYAADHAETSFFLADVPLEDLLNGKVRRGSVVHINLLWVPLAGSTPMDSSATNVSVRFVVFADGEVGIYGGAGFAKLHGKSGQEELGLSIRDASLTLLESTDGFVDLLSPARLSGRLHAALDDLASRQIQYAASQMVTNALGRTRLVGREGHQGTLKGIEASRKSAGRALLPLMP